MNKKILIIIAASVLILVIVMVWLFVRKPASQTTSNANNPALPNTNNSASLNTNTGDSNVNAQNQAGKLTDNFVRCDFGGDKGVEFKMHPPSYAPPREGVTSVDPVWGETYLGAMNAASAKAESIQFNFPGKTTIDYALPKDERLAYGIHYGMNTSNTTSESFATDPENGDTFQIKVTKYEGNVIEGTFPGEVTSFEQATKRISFKNCSFKSSLAIVAQ